MRSWCAVVVYMRYWYNTITLIKASYKGYNRLLLQKGIKVYPTNNNASDSLILGQYTNMYTKYILYIENKSMS